MPRKQDPVVRVFAYGAKDGKFYRVTVTVDMQALAQEAARKGLIDSVTKRATRANGAVIVEAEEVTPAQAQAVVAAGVQ